MRILLPASLVLALAASGPATLGARQTPGQAAPGVAPRASGTVFGNVWGASNRPIPRAAVQLRNLVTGAVDMRALTREDGAFTFGRVTGGTYLVEYVEHEGGRILAVGPVFSIAASETVATFIRLGSRAPRDLLGTAATVASIVVASAATLGVTALAGGGRPVSPEG